MALRERIVEALATAALDDDRLAARLGVVRQQINQACRALESRGVLIRVVGSNGKIVNRLTGSSGSQAAQTAPAPRALPRAIGLPAQGPLTEDEVKKAVSDHLSVHGFAVTVAWGHIRGIDIEARRGDERWAIEAKGAADTDQKGGTYFLNALGELLQRMSDERARYALALPENRRNLGLVERLPAVARRRLGLTVFFVRRDGDGYAVRELPPAEEHAG